MYCNVSDANRRAMAFTHLRAAFTFYASFAARFPIPPPPRHIFSVLSLLLLLSFSLAFSRMLLVHPNPHLAFSPNISLSLSLTPTSQPRWGTRRRGLCAIVVSRLLFPGNSTSFTNYPLRAHAVRKWRCSPGIVAGDDAPAEKGDGL